MDARAESILKILDQHPKGLGFREIMGKLELNQVPLQKRLKDLLSQNSIVVVNAKKWMRGRKKIYMLTKRGKKEAQALLNIESIIKDIHHKVCQIAEKLGNIKSWSRNSRLRDKSSIIRISVEIEKT